MRFCKQCDSLMTKRPLLNGHITFNCHCGVTEDGCPADTLMAEGVLGAETSNLQHEVFIENSAFDDAAYRVHKDCPAQCGLDFLTMIRVGEKETTMYTCSCGYRGV